ncbi:MAG TPA: recombination protein O N-terminal domain-containing protein, partial [Longimicrobiales bacterium]|nr:recombination protein O N-terminal domain-containing protein [Longimicrobiales bacterium]
MGVVTTRAVLLRSHPYSETSLVLRFFSEDLGTVGVMARGARRGGSRGGSSLSTFAGGSLTLYVKETRELQTFKDFAVTCPRQALARDLLRFGGASVVGELVLRHGGEAGAPALYGVLEEALDALVATPPADLVTTILASGWTVVATLGYHPV